MRAADTKRMGEDTNNVRQTLVGCTDKLLGCPRDTLIKYIQEPHPLKQTKKCEMHAKNLPTQIPDPNFFEANNV